MHVYQAVHDSSVQNIQVNRVNDGITSVRLNLVNTEHLKSLLKYIASHSHNIELCVFQPNFSSAPNIEALSLEEIEHSWQTTGLSAVSVSQAVIKPMLKQQRGTVIFLGAPSNNSAHYDVKPKHVCEYSSVITVIGKRVSAQRYTCDILHGGKWDGQNQHFISSVSKSVSTSINNLTLHGAKSLACLEILLSIVLKIEYCFGMTTEQ